MEARSIGRIENAGIFKNVTEEMIRNVVKEKREQIGVRKGFKELVKSVIERGGNVDVLSVNWSFYFISHFLHSVLHSSEMDGRVGVLSNNFSSDGYLNRGTTVVTKSLNPQGLEIYKIGYTHGIDSEWNETDSGIWTTGDKLSVMNQVLELSWKAAHKEGRNPRVVYIGDSMTDLAALIAADIGVCIRDGNGEIESQVGEKKVLGETLERVGVGVEWAERIKELVGDGEVGSREGEGEKMLYWAKDFDEVREALFER